MYGHYSTVQKYVKVVKLKVPHPDNSAEQNFSICSERYVIKKSLLHDRAAAWRESKSSQSSYKTPERATPS